MSEKAAPNLESVLVAQGALTPTDAGQLYLALHAIAANPNVQVSVFSTSATVGASAHFSEGPYEELDLTFAGYTEELSQHFVNNIRKPAPFSTDQINSAGGIFELTRISRDPINHEPSIFFLLTPQGYKAVTGTSEGFVEVTLTDQEMGMVNVLSLLTLAGDRINNGLATVREGYRSSRFIDLIRQCDNPIVQNVFQQNYMNGILSMRRGGNNGVFINGLEIYLETVANTGKNAISAFRRTVDRSTFTAIQ